jgi:hypothetical protein
LDNPSGSFITFNSEAKDTLIGTITPKNIKQAKPRLAVALDFADIMGREHSLGFLKGNLGGVIKSFESNSDDGPFKLEVNPLMKIPNTVDWIKEVTLHVFDNSASYSITLSPEFKGSYYQMTPNSYSKLNRTLENKDLVFLSLTTNENLTGLFSHYDQKSPWTFQVSIQSRSRAMRSRRRVDLPGYIISRHSVYGEIPNHRWYSRIKKTEFNFPWETHVDE